jgi:hypothetical protein
MFAEIQRAVALGSKYGLKGIAMYTDSTVATPEMDDTAMEGAVGIVITVAAVIIALYITAIVTGAMSKVVAPGGTGIVLTPAWNTTITGMDTQATSSFSLAGILPIAIVGVGILVIIISAFAMR